MAKSPAAVLRPHLTELIGELRCTGRVPRGRVPLLVAYLETLHVAPKRTAAAIKVSQEHSRAIGQGIRKAAGPLPLSERGLAGTIQRRIARGLRLEGPAAFGLTSVPCLRVIRRTLATMRAEQAARNACTSITSVHIGFVPHAHTPAQHPDITARST